VTDLIELIREVIDDHRAATGPAGVEACSCGAQGLSDHPRHVAEELVERLDLKPERINEVKKQIRYASAWLEGAE
jgi:hypothetical protein